MAGHSHAGVAHFVEGVPVIQSFSGGRAFGRIDLTLAKSGGVWQLQRERTRIFPPHEVCDMTAKGPASPGGQAAGQGGQAAGQPAAQAGQPAVQKGGEAGHGGPPSVDLLSCDSRALAGAALELVTYEGAPVVADAAVAATLAVPAAALAARRAEPLGVTLTEKLGRSYRAEAPLSQALAELIRQGAALQTGAQVDVGLQNGGGIRADLPSGPLTYGEMYEVLPFDNRLATMQLTGAQLAELFRLNLQSSSGVLVPSGIPVEARCQGAALQVQLLDNAGRPQPPTKTYTVATSDFLASGGDSFGPLLAKLPAGAVKFYDDAPPLRELVIEALRKRGLPQKDTPRLAMPMPARCAAGQEKPRPPLREQAQQRPRPRSRCSLGGGC